MGDQEEEESYHSDDAYETFRGCCGYCDDISPKRYYFVRRKISSKTLFCPNEKLLNGFEDASVNNTDEEEVDYVLERFPCHELVREGVEMVLKHVCKCTELVPKYKIFTIVVCKRCYNRLKEKGFF